MPKNSSVCVLGLAFLFVLIGAFHRGPAVEEASAAKAQKTSQAVIGQKAPDFALKNQDQLNVSLSDFQGKKNVILVFYPLDFTPV